MTTALRTTSVLIAIAVLATGCLGSGERDGHRPNVNPGLDPELAAPVDTMPQPPPCEAEVVVTDVEVGGDSTCAISEGGQLYCWGRGQWFDEPVETPTRVNGISGAVRSVALGSSHGCALTELGAVWCWGANDLGQLGNGAVDASDEPTPVSTLTDVEQIAAGHSHTCALDEAARSSAGATTLSARSRRASSPSASRSPCGRALTRPCRSARA